MSIPLYLRKRNIKKESLKRERDIVKQILIPSSGSLWYSKGDFSIDDYLIEAKTGKKETKIKLEHLKKIFSQANRKSKTPLMIFDFGTYYLIGEVRRR